MITPAGSERAWAGAAGREIRHVPVTTEEFFAGMARAGVPAEYGDLLRYLFEITRSGVNAHITDGVQRALGRPPRSFSEFAVQAAAAGAISEIKGVSRG